MWCAFFFISFFQYFLNCYFPKVSIHEKSEIKKKEKFLYRQCEIALTQKFFSPLFLLCFIPMIYITSTVCALRFFQVSRDRDLISLPELFNYLGLMISLRGNKVQKTKKSEEDNKESFLLHSGSLPSCHCECCYSSSLYAVLLPPWPSLHVTNSYFSGERI